LGGGGLGVVCSELIALLYIRSNLEL